MASQAISFTPAHLLSSDAERGVVAAHLGHGVVAGSIGAVAVALVFLVIDSITVGPMATPNALGQSLFLGKPFQLDRSLAFTPIAAYTMLHGAIFVGIAYFGAAIIAAVRGSLSNFGLTAVGTAAIFTACQAVIMSFAYSSQFPTLEFDVLRVAYANLLSAFLMTRLLMRMLGTSKV